MGHLFGGGGPAPVPAAQPESTPAQPAAAKHVPDSLFEPAAPSGSIPPPPPPPPLLPSLQASAQPVIPRTSTPEVIQSKFAAESESEPEVVSGPSVSSAAAAVAHDPLSTSDEWEVVNDKSVEAFLPLKNKRQSNIFASSNEIFSQPIEQETPSSELPPVRRARVLFDYQGTGGEDLSVHVGDVIVVERDADEWLYCSISSGASGWVPKNFVDLADPTLSAGDGSGGISDAHTDATVPAIGRAVVLFDFTAQRDDELTVYKDSVLDILSKAIPEWWRVRNEARQVGLVPANFLSETAAADGNGGSFFERGGDGDASGGAGGDGTGTWGAGAPDSDPSSLQHGAAADSYGSLSRTGTSRGGGGGGGGHFGYAIVTSVSTDFQLPHQPPTPAKPASTPHLPRAVDPATMSVEERKLYDAGQEMILTERNYVDDLRVMIELFFEPLEHEVPQISAVFSNIRQILSVNELILADFEKHDSGESAETIGEIFLKYLDDLECYKVYCSNLSNASEALQKLRSENPSLDAFLKSQQQNPRCKKLDLSSFLLVPMQRITRYSLLLRQMLHYTPKDHPQHEPTLIALQMSDELLEKLNAATKERQTLIKLREITRTVDLAIPEEGFRLELTQQTRMLGRRLFLHEGTLAKNKSGRKLSLFLFNDMLLLVQAKPSNGMPASLYRKPLMIADMAVREAVKTPGKDVGAIDKTCLQIIDAGDVITLRAASASDKRQWINQIEAAISAYTAASKRRMSVAGGAALTPTRLGQTIGTLEVRLHQATHLGSIERGGRALEVFAIVQVHQQVTKSKRVPSTYPRWNQSLMFSVTTLDDVIKIALYAYDPYSEDEYLGQAQLQMDILEYYVSGKETERMVLDLRDVPNGKVEFQLVYRLARGSRIRLLDVRCEGPDSSMMGTIGARLPSPKMQNPFEDDVPDWRADFDSHPQALRASASAASSPGFEALSHSALGRTHGQPPGAAQHPATHGVGGGPHPADGAGRKPAHAAAARLLEPWLSAAGLDATEKPRAGQPGLVGDSLELLGANAGGLPGTVGADDSSHLGVLSSGGQSLDAHGGVEAEQGLLDTLDTRSAVVDETGTEPRSGRRRHPSRTRIEKMPEQEFLRMVAAQEDPDTVRMLVHRRLRYIASNDYAAKMHSMPFWKIAISRCPAIIATLSLELLVGAVIASKHDLIRVNMMITSFLPVLSSIAGADVWSVMDILFKEFCASLVVAGVAGIALASISANWAHAFDFGMATGMAIFFNSAIAGIMGAFGPLLFRALKIDPALMAGPFETAMQDLIGSSVYLGLCTLILARQA
nr:Intersectin 1 (SH3 domain protein) [Polyrhizophydium stewartii]